VDPSSLPAVGSSGRPARPLPHASEGDPLAVALGSNPLGSRGYLCPMDCIWGRACRRHRASGPPSGLAAAIAGRFRLGIEVGIFGAPGVTSGGGGLALLIARKAAVTARPSDVAALDAIGILTRRCGHRGRARDHHHQKCPTHRCAHVQSFVASRQPRQQSVNSRSLDESSIC
jgi:hypothetical protein